ncbi:MAG: sulfatase family protein [Planctomycetota bacterium]|jgi:arylsulfatase A-like enzyme
MDRRKFMKLGGAALAAAAVPRAARGAGKRPNTLFMMSDDHTSQAIGCYGLRLSACARTPNIDRVRAEGALLRNCFCTNSICVPSRATILTGQYGHVNGAKTLSGRLSPKADNVAKRLRAAGYRTAIVGKWHLKETPAGFDYYNVLRGQGRYHNPVLFGTGADWKKGGREHEGHSTDVITDEALKWLKRRPDDRPFCMMCHFKAVHEPFYSHDRYRGLYSNEKIPEPEDLLWPESPKGKRFEGWPLEILKDRFLKSPKRYSPPRLDVRGMTPDEARRATYQKFMKDYLRAVAGIDENVGRLLSYLDEAGLAGNTVVIYTADQGYSLGEHNMFDKRFMLEESLRMPFLVRYPAEIEPRTTLEEIVLNLDFAELMLDYAGVEPPAGMQGRSFRANLRGKRPADWRDAMYYHYWSHQKPRPSHYGVRTSKHKLIYYYGATRLGRAPADCWEFYDLEKDPRELRNVYGAPEHSNVIGGLKERLGELRREFGDTADPIGKG